MTTKDSEYKRISRKLESALMVSIECLELLGKKADAERIRKVLRSQVKIQARRRL